MEKEKKHGLRNTVISILFFIGASVVGAICTNLTLVNRIDERVRGIQNIIDQHEFTSFTDSSRYERWLKSVNDKVDSLTSRVIKLEYCYDEMKKQMTFVR